MQKTTWVVLVLVSTVLVGCGGGNSTPIVGGGGGTLALSAADQAGVTPCPTQTILTDAAELTALKDALQNGSYVHLDVPFGAGPADIFQRKCGLEGFWNPADNVDEIAGASPLTIASVFIAGNAGICAAGFDAGSFGMGEGFPVAGTYRKEFKVAHMAMTYHARLRVVVTGTSAGNKFTDEGLANPPDFDNDLVYEVDGTVTPHADVLNAMIAALVVVTDTAPTATLGVRLASGGPVIWTAKVEIICVAKL